MGVRVRVLSIVLLRVVSHLLPILALMYDPHPSHCVRDLAFVVELLVVRRLEGQIYVAQNNLAECDQAMIDHREICGSLVRYLESEIAQVSQTVQLVVVRDEVVFVMCGVVNEAVSVRQDIIPVGVVGEKAETRCFDGSESSGANGNRELGCS
jgi:hypothetical protein